MYETILHYLTDYNRYAQICGIAGLLAIAFLFSRNKKAVQPLFILKCLFLQTVLALLILKVPAIQSCFQQIAAGISLLYGCANKGIEFLFGPLARGTGENFIFAVKILPVIIFFGACMSLLFYLRIIPLLVNGISFFIRPFLGVSGAETLCAVGNSFLGQTEAPLLIKNYLNSMTKSELLVVMVSGMGSISAAILAVYTEIGIPAVHLLTASIMSIPSTLLMAKILYPETETPQTLRGVKADAGSSSGNLLDALSQGTSDGLMLALNVGAMLIAFIALLAMTDSLLLYATQALLGTSYGLQNIFATLCAPFAWFLGLTGAEQTIGAELIGVKIAVNEMIAYLRLASAGLSERATILLTYALCGFSNFSCIGIQLGGIGALVPERRKELSELGLYAVLGGALANLMSAMIVGLIL
jgi:CNT family concentrative nucleoside transporter